MRRPVGRKGKKGPGARRKTPGAGVVWRCSFSGRSLWPESLPYCLVKVALSGAEPVVKVSVLSVMSS